METLVDSRIVSIDPHGDLKIQVATVRGDERSGTCFHVCSRTLARVSPVFEKMLYNQHSESIQSKCPVEISGHGPEAFEVFALACHGLVHRIPGELPLDNLYDLTVFTNAFEATATLVPWAQDWVDSIGEPMSAMAMFKLLWVSWELGRRCTLETIAKRIILECRGSHLAERSPLNALQMPPGVVERIATIRKRTIASMFEVMRDLIHDLTSPDQPPRVCQHRPFLTSNPCESMILGSLTIGLMRSGFWPLPRPEDMDASVLEVYEKLSNIVIYDAGQASREDIDHGNCNPMAHLTGQFRNIVENIPSPVTGPLIERLEFQYRKLYH